MRRVDSDPHATNGYPHTEEFLRFAAASFGTSVALHGRYEAILPGSAVTLQTFKPPEVHYRKRLPPFVISLYAVREKVPTDHESGERLFEGTVTESISNKMKKGDNVIGLASPECPVLIVNTSDLEDMAHLMATYDDPQYREHVTL